MKKCLSILFFLLLISFSLFSQDIYPAHWWAGMKNPTLQLMIHGEQIGAYSKVSLSYPGITVLSSSRVENNNYLFVNLKIDAAKPGKFKLTLSDGAKQKMELTYELKAKNNEDGKTRIQGITSKDLIYLLMPDRFSNGEPSNDRVAGLKDTACDRNNKFIRHGGDLRGVENHLDYFNELGATAIWMTPVLENDMPLELEAGEMRAGYHGYWFTDHYKVDPRFGGNEAYIHLVNEAHKKGLKIIQDAVYNQVGAEHWFVKDLPMKDWINQFPSYTPSNHKEEAVFDQNGSPKEKAIMLDGWFTPHLPDLNLKNPYLAKYMIQQAIWNTEEFGIDGWRVDTYKYCDEKFLNAINSDLIREFPSITVFGEAWSTTVIGNAYFAQNNLDVPFKHNLQGVTNFPLAFAMLSGISQNYGGAAGVNNVYTTLAQDLVYKDPSRNCIFLDNHDLDRAYSVAGEDWDKLKMGLTWLLTLKGIPQLYYGTEILMKNLKVPSDAEVRYDFPGGWKEDKVNKFDSVGRTKKENEAFNYIRKLAHFRKASSAITTGKLMQYIPRDGLYVYFRYNKDETVMVITHSGNSEKKVEMSYYGERTNGFSKMQNIMTGETLPLANFTIKPKECLVFKLMK